MGIVSALKGRTRPEFRRLDDILARLNRTLRPKSHRFDEVPQVISWRPILQRDGAPRCGC